MGNNQATTTNGTTTEYASSTEQDAPIDDQFAFLNETSKLSAKYFGGEALQHDPSIHKMQHDLLTFDETIKNLFSRRKNTKESNGYNDQDQSTTINGDISPSLASITDTSNNKLIWRCTYCSAENKIAEQACRRCRQAETKL
jgi:ribosomal protein L40E